MPECEENEDEELEIIQASKNPFFNYFQEKKKALDTKSLKHSTSKNVCYSPKFMSYVEKALETSLF